MKNFNVQKKICLSEFLGLHKKKDFSLDENDFILKNDLLGSKNADAKDKDSSLVNQFEKRLVSYNQKESRKEINKIKDNSVEVKEYYYEEFTRNNPCKIKKKPETSKKIISVDPKGRQALRRRISNTPKVGTIKKEVNFPVFEFVPNAIKCENKKTETSKDLLKKFGNFKQIKPAETLITVTNQNIKIVSKSKSQVLKKKPVNSVTEVSLNNVTSVNENPIPTYYVRKLNYN